MERLLYVAAGGGGDAITAMMLHAAEGHSPASAHVATYAWERLAVDPIPGPRGPEGFIGLEPVGQRNHRITPSTTTRPPGDSTLPRLSAERAEHLYLLDPSGGAPGLRAQLEELAQIVGAGGVRIIDVGGDILAEGTEERLRSPFADALVLAAASGLAVPTEVLVVGPGLDGELDEDLVVARCRELEAEAGPTLRKGSLDPFAGVFAWHASEASGLLWAAARGVRGLAEIRDSGLQVRLSDASAGSWRVSPAAAYSINLVAQAARNADSLDAAEEAVAAAGLMNELTYERSKAEQLERAGQREPSRAEDAQLEAGISALLRDARDRNVDYLTVRRISEGLKLQAGGVEAVRAVLQQRFAQSFDPPLVATQQG